MVDSDKILVLEEGHVVEFDHPYNLLRNKDSEFYDLLMKTDSSEFLDSTKIAEEVIIINKRYRYLF